MVSRARADVNNSTVCTYRQAHYIKGIHDQQIDWENTARFQPVTQGYCAQNPFLQAQPPPKTIDSCIWILNPQVQLQA